MNAAELRAAIEHASAIASKHPGEDAATRARIFVASLTGWLKVDEPALSAMVWEVLNRPQAVSAAVNADA